MSSPRNTVPLKDVEVRAIVYRTRFALRPHRGLLMYRTLATRGYAFPSFWLELRKRDGLGGDHPLCKARSRESLLDKLRAEAALLGNVTKWSEEVRDV